MPNPIFALGLSTNRIANTLQKRFFQFILDLSQPKELWHTYQTLHEAVAKRVKSCISEASKQNPTIKDKLKESLLKRIGNAVG